MIKKILLLTIVISTSLIACKKDEDNEPQNNNNPSAPVDFPTNLANVTLNMELTTENAGCPYTLNQKANFFFESNGNMKIDVNPATSDGFEHDFPFDQKSNSEYWWKDTNKGHTYALSFKPDNTVNEINIFTTSNMTFLGQFTPIDTSSQNLVVNYKGNYNVSNVDKGTHSRMSLSIDAAGNIDFDDGIELMSSEFELVSDRLDCCDGIWVDMKPYPSEPYPRIQLFVDPTTGDLIRLEYSPEYPNVSGRVFVDVTQ